MAHPLWALLKEDGELMPLEGKHDLAGLQNAVGGLVEHIDGPHGEDLWINEEGKYQPGLRKNVLATDYLRKHQRLMPGDYIMGNVVITAISEKRWEKLQEEFPEGRRAVEVFPGFTIQTI